jgi:Beta-propeller repeat
MNLLGGNRHASVTGADALLGKSHYFIGSDPSRWRSNVPTYAAVKYTGVYPGIDLVYHGNQRLLEYDFRVAPGADPRAIEIRFRGARKLSLNREGALVIGLDGSEVIEPAPVVYQEIEGERRMVAGRYELRGKSRVGFRVTEYDRSRPLVIDPTLVYSTYLGGSSSAYGPGIALDTSGNAYVMGSAELGFPSTAGAFQTTYGGNFDVFVAKLNAAGSALLYSTYLGGRGQESPEAISVDAFGDAYVIGMTYLSNFPTTSGAFRSRSTLRNP